MVEKHWNRQKFGCVRNVFHDSEGKYKFSAKTFVIFVITKMGTCTRNIVIRANTGLELWTKWKKTSWKTFEEAVVRRGRNRSMTA
jgi:hypothetical protein